MNYKFFISFILILVSYNLFGQISDTTFFRDKKFSKPTTKSKARYMTINKTGPLNSVFHYSLKPLELISSHSYKSDDSLNYWRSVDIIGELKRIKTQNDSIFELIERKVSSNELIGTAKYKVKLSERDKYAVEQLKNLKSIYDDEEITLPVFNSEIDFLKYMFLAAKPVRGYRLEVPEDEEYVEGSVIIRIDFDVNAKIKDLVILEGYVSEIDMGFYIVAINENKWETPALKNGEPIEFTYYFQLMFREYKPIIVIDGIVK